MADEKGFVLKQGSNKAVLVLHGLTGSPFEMKQYSKFLYKHGYDVYCPNIPGHGESLEYLKESKCEDWIEFSLRQYDDLSLSYEEVYVSGICLGAVLALVIAINYSHIKGIITLSNILFLDGWTMPWYKFLFPIGLNTVFRYFYSFPEKDPYGIKNLAVRKRISAMLKKNEVAFDCIPMTVVYELLELSKYVRGNINYIKCPILLMHSNEDDLSGLKSAYFVYDNICSEQKELVILENSYHLLVMDNEKDFVFEKSIEFLNKTQSVTMFQGV